MSLPNRVDKPRPVEASLEDMELKDETPDSQVSVDRLHIATPHTAASTSDTSPSSPKRIKKSHSLHSSPSLKAESDMASPVSEVVGGEITVKLEPGKGPKLSRTASQKVVARKLQMFDHLEDSTEAATSVFQVITDCIYGSKHMGSSEHDVLECDCAENWNGKKNIACDEDSDCINRATKMECVDNECNCGPDCQNQRFQKKDYAKVSVIKTEKKGYGLRCDRDLQPNDFIFEYIGEVINENNFRKRMLQYDEEGIKHFYFMSLSKNEFVDATKKGNLGRFCNHSCNPNCYVDKWVVGDKFRMGIFAERKISAGEELVFNYNVDRYGADPQPCYCGEPNCTGFIGGKTQTERATKLSTQVLEALGIGDGDGWDTAVSKRPRKKKVGEDDEEYVNNVQPKALDEYSVTKVVASLMQSKEKWIAVKLLGRIQQCESDLVRNRVVRMHGYVALKTVLNNFKGDANVVLQVLDVLQQMPRLTRNKIQDAKIETVIEELCNHEDDRVPPQASIILKEWAKLELGYRIPRRKEQDAPRNTFERRESNEQFKKPRARSITPEAPKGPSGSSAPSGPRYTSTSNGYTPMRSGPNPRNSAPPLPRGWFAAPTADGRTYYYSATCPNGTWTRPDKPAVPPPPPPKQNSKEQRLKEMVDKIIEDAEAAQKAKQLVAAAPPKPAPVARQEAPKPKEKWRTYSLDKQKKVYENTVFPAIIYVLDKYKKKLPRDDLKRFGKEISKLISASDYKHNRVEDPTKLTVRQEKQIKKFSKDFLDKAVAKKKVRDKQKYEKRKAEKEKLAKAGDKAAAAELKSQEDEEARTKDPSDDDQPIEMSDVEEDGDDQKVSLLTNFPQGTPVADDLKRKREGGYESTASAEGTPTKRFRSATPPLPPPPPPPMDNNETMVDPSIGLQDQIDSLQNQNSP